MDPWIWFAVAALLLVAEMLTVHLLFASLALAALGAAITNIAGGTLTLQGIMFAIFAAISLLFLRPIALRHLNRQSSAEATNVDALIGAQAFVTSVVNQRDGQIKLNGEIWSARTEEDEEIPDGEKVLVLAIDGAIARVTKSK
jgi:membrane protein implicated in regulation of membrane protease activity